MSTARDDWVLRVSNVGCTYPNYENSGQGGLELRGVFTGALEIPGHGITAIIGGSGSGKSTLLGLLTGLRGNTVGPSETQLLLLNGKEQVEYLIDGGNRLPPGQIAFVFQESQLIKTIETRRNALLGAMLVQEPFMHEHVEDMAEAMGLSPQMDTLSETLSGGQAQRAAVIRALAVSPRLIVCDEPTSSLDNATAEVVMNEIHGWAEENDAAVLWVTHNLEQAAQYADYVMLVAKGQVIVDDESHRPFALSGHDINGRRSLIGELDSFANKIPTLTEGYVEQSLHKPAPQSWVRGTARRRWSLTDFNILNWFRLRVFLIQCAWADVMSGKRRAESKGKRGVRAAIAGAGVLMMRSLTWVFLLGFIVFYAVAKADSSITWAIEQRLHAPEMSHFVLSASGGSNITLDQQTLVQLARSIGANASLAAGDETATGLQIFGRREGALTRYWVPAVDGDCEAEPSGGAATERLQGFDASEPLFARLIVTQQDGVQAPLGRLQDGDPRGVVLTAALVEDKWESQVPRGICIDRFVTEYYSVIGFASELPGGARRSFQIGLTAGAYQEALLRTRPEILRNDDGQFVLPTFSTAALYFDYREVTAVKCSFEQFEGCEDTGQTVLSGFKLNEDVLGQIDGFIRLLDGSATSFVLLGFAFALSIGISTALAVRAFVESNQKSIAIMAAFGYQLTHVLLMLLTQIVALLITSLLIFLLLLVSFDTFGLAYVAGTFNIPTQLVQFDLGLVWLSLGRLAVVAFVIATIVLAYWWRRNRYLGETLQAA